MEIKIDTKKDSSEDIKKAISFLQKLIEEKKENYQTPTTSFNLFENNDDQSSDKPSQLETKESSEKKPEINFKPIFY